MYKELYNKDIFSLFDFQSFRIFQTAAELCENKNLPTLEQILLSLIYVSPELFALVDYELKIKLEADLKKITRSFFFSKLTRKNKLERFLENLAGMVKSQQNLITPQLIFIALWNDKLIRLVLENRLENLELIIKKISLSGNINSSIILPLTFSNSGKNFKLIGKDSTINIIKESLGTYFSNNLLIIGRTGVGKSALASSIPLIIRADKKLSTEVRSLKIFQINSVEDFFCFEKMEKNNLIDQPSLLLVDLKENKAKDLLLISQSFASEKISGKLIIFVNPEIYHSIIKLKPDFFKSFSITELQEPVEEENIEIIKDFSPELEKYHDIFIPDIIIKPLIEYSNKFSNFRALPGRALKILDEACYLAKRKEASILEESHLLELVGNWHNL